jgi:hypothetical protein
MCLSSQPMGKAEVGGSVSVQAGQKSFRDPHLNGKKLDVVVCTCHPIYSGKCKIGSWSAWAKYKTLSPGQKGLEAWLKLLNACPESTKPWGQTIVQDLSFLSLVGLEMKILGLGCSLVVQRLPSMCEALGLIPAPKKKRQKKKEMKIPLDQT